MTTFATAITASFERAPWGWALAGSVILAIIKGWPAIVDASLRAKMALGDRRVSRIEKLEKKIDDQRVSYEAEIGVLRASYEAEISILRHELNNVTQAFEALLTRIEIKPEAAAEHAERIREMRARQQTDSTAEKATIRAAKIIAAVPNAAASPAEEGGE
ncbi:hypothetical protein [Sphingomonas sp. Leaf10]|uniref:hypothetical protein n=1 Tax=Sphingomonas sp. Leaf10 TaxID=1735676 RepID=UPI0006FB9BEB|nr:hypothetical protein [Sphingomonas sp. Leaf10]KQM37926.1 hypothetical protein ASE59_11540 [Sphingomonas sp. Leaf10]